MRNPAATVDQHLSPFAKMRTIATAPGVGAVLKRARVPYRRSPLSEDEALNLVCDARTDEPTHPLEKLLKKYKHGLGD